MWVTGAMIGSGSATPSEVRSDQCLAERLDGVRRRPMELPMGSTDHDRPSACFTSEANTEFNVAVSFRFMTR